MAFEVVAPRNRWSRAALVFERWLADDGDWVKQNSPVCAIDINGVSVPVYADHDGFLTVTAEQLKRGSVLLPGAVIGYVVRPSEAPPTPPAAPAAIPLPPHRAVPASGPRLRQGWQPPRKKRAASPRARSAARRAGIPLRAVQGSGPAGRILERDVLAAAPAIAATGGAVVPMCCIHEWVLDKTLLEVTAGEVAWLRACCAKASAIIALARVELSGDEPSIDGENTMIAKLRLVLPDPTRAGVYRTAAVGDGAMMDQGELIDELEADMVPVYVASNANTGQILPPLPPGTVVAIGFGSPCDRAIVRDGKVVGVRTALVAIRYDSQKIPARSVENWFE